MSTELSVGCYYGQIVGSVHYGDLLLTESVYALSFASRSTPMRIPICFSRWKVLNLRITADEVGSTSARPWHSTRPMKAILSALGVTGLTAQRIPFFALT